MKTRFNSLKDENVLVKVQGQDLIALEAKYYKNCLGRYFLKVKEHKTLQKIVNMFMVKHPII